MYYFLFEAGSRAIRGDVYVCTYLFDNYKTIERWRKTRFNTLLFVYGSEATMVFVGKHTLNK